jgi:hypothetical protein
MSTHNTIYDEETNTHWAIEEGQTLKEIQEVIKIFKTEKKSNVKAKKLLNSNLIKDNMNAENKTILAVMAKDGADAAMEAMVVDENGLNMTYSEIRSRFG